jgi:predicted HAD superfamily Cof-like phosphohydrolase
MKKKMVVLSVMLMVAVYFVGCASSGRQFDTTHVNDIKKGVHGKADILAVNGKVKVYQLWENKSVPPLGRKKELMRGQQAWDHLLVWGKDSC